MIASLRWPTTALVSALMLAGCASSAGLRPTGHLTEISALAMNQSLTGVPLSPAAWPAQDWWTGLNDFQLNGLIAEAQKANPTLAMADARAQEAQAQVSTVHANLEPEVTGGASAAGARLPTTVLPSQENGGHYQLAKYADVRFTWGPDLWGGKRAAWVASAYADLSAAFALQDVAQAERQRATQVRDLTAQRVAAGIDNQIQLSQSDSEVATAEQQVAAAGHRIEHARAALSVLLGAGPDRGLTLARPTATFNAMVWVPDQVNVELIGHRTDLVAARWRVEAASHDIKTAKTQFLPNVSLSALAGLITLGGGNLFEAPARGYQVGPSLSLPIFDGGRLRANLSGANARYDEAVAHYNQTLVQAVNALTDAVANVRSLDEQLAAQKRAQASAEHAWSLATARDQAGIGSYLDALSVRQQLLEAQRATTDLQAQRAQALLTVIGELGGGYTPAVQAPRLPSLTPSVTSTRF
jgi:outer membrane protein TolC